MTTFTLLKAAERWRKDPEFRAAYDALDEEFAIASQSIHARIRGGLTQQQLAERMHTSQSAITRLESGIRLHAGEGRGGKRIEAADGVEADLNSEFRVESANEIIGRALDPGRPAAG